NRLVAQEYAAYKFSEPRYNHWAVTKLIQRQQLISPTEPIGRPRVLPQVASASVADRCSATQVPTLLQELCSHSIQLFAGLNASELRELLDAASDSPGPETARPILLLGLPQAHRTEIIIADAIDQLARAATGLWPLWFGGEDFSELNDSVLSHHYLPIKL